VERQPGQDLNVYLPDVLETIKIVGKLILSSDGVSIVFIGQYL